MQSLDIVCKEQDVQLQNTKQRNAFPCSRDGFITNLYEKPSLDQSLCYNDDRQNILLLYPSN